MEDQPLIKQYNFRTVKNPDGTESYFVNDTKLKDKAAYDRIKQKSDQISNQYMLDEQNQANKSFDNMSADFDKSAGGFSKGGKVSSASKRADGCAVKGKTKGRFV